jgi:hypothetical protein
MEFWTTVRFLLYPVMLVAGAAWATLMLRHYRCQRCAEAAWAFWMGLAVAVQGAAGFASLLVSNALGFGALSSAVFTLGPLAVTIVTTTGAAVLLVAAWRRSW